MDYKCESRKDIYEKDTKNLRIRMASYEGAMG